MVLSIVGLIAIVVFGTLFLLDVFAGFERPRWRKQSARRRQTATGQVDDLFAEARIRMEEAAGRRQPGEQRIGDGIRRSWRSW